MNKMKSMLLLLALAVATSAPVLGGIQALEFKDRAQEQRYRKLAEQLRCLVCQNQSLADSNADLARDLRIELLRQINHDKTDQEIIDYLVSRYGDFVRYKPPLKTSTYLLWFGPFLILLLAVVGLIRVIRSREHAQPVEDLTGKDNERLQSLLNQDKDR